MPTARELLEQADALMRRNRSVGGGESGIPVLTDSVPDARAEPSRWGPATRERNSAALRVPAGDARIAHSNDHASPRSVSPRAHSETAANSADAPDASAPFAEKVAVPDDAEPPVLTDAVEEEAIDLALLPVEKLEDEALLWLGPDTIDPALHSITGPAPDTVGVVPPVTVRAVASPSAQIGAGAEDEAPDSTATRTFRAAGSATVPPPAGSTPPDATFTVRASDDERWRALAEQISMQVLQRLDLFIDTGLKAQLAAHLQPIVERAGAGLVETINDHVGQLVRTYVAEAIEREIAQWRQQQR